MTDATKMLQTTAEIRAQQPQEELHDTRTLGRDFLALVTIFLIVVTYHIQNPLLQFEVKFGTAFRNVTLQPVLALALIVCVWGLIGNWRELFGNGVGAQGRTLLQIKRIAAIILIVYCVYIALAVILKFNVLGAALGIPQEVFLDMVDEETAPLAALTSALTISTVVEYLALIAVVILWSPWERLPVYRRSVGKQLAAVLVAVIVLGLWELIINIGNIQAFLLPKPSVIGGQFLDIYPRLVSVGWNSFQNAFWGFVVGCGLGILTGLVAARFTSFSNALLPLAIAANSVPIIAFAPIFNNWFGALNPSSKIAIVAVLTYFPAMISTVKGLSSANNLAVELMRSYAASEWEIFRKLRFPSALPYIFSALKVSTTLAMIGAIVSEYFGGATTGLGYRIREDAALFKYPESWAAIIIASLLGILFYMLVSALERVVMPWHVSFRDE
jgi:NitT/TauT family transport system permease protein